MSDDLRPATVEPALPPSVWPARLGLAAVSVLGGALFSAPFRWPEVAGLQWLSLLPLLWVLARCTPQQAFRQAWLFGFAATAVGYDHMLLTITRFGKFPWVAAIPIFALFCAWTAVSFGLFGWLARRISAAGQPLVIALAWVAVEVIFPNIFPRKLASTQVDLLPFLQAADLAGMDLLGFAMAWAMASAFALLAGGRGAVALSTRARIANAAGSAVLLAGLLVYGLWRIGDVKAWAQKAPALAVGTIQPNIPAGDHLDPRSFPRHYALQHELTAKLLPADLVVWPESSRLLFYADWVVGRDFTHPALIDGGYRPFPQGGVAILFGALGYTPNPDRTKPDTYNNWIAKYNRNLLMSPAGKVLGYYDKHILMPFGEYMPGATLVPALRKLSPMTSSFNPGTSLAPLTLDSGARLGVMSCYEDMVPAVPRVMVRDFGAQALFVLLNDNWFGETAAPRQHMTLALPRAVELRRYLVRSTNTGVSAIIAPWGEVVAEIPPFTVGVNKADIRLLDGVTLYARIGDVFGWTCVGLTGLLLIGASFRRKPADPATA